MCGGGGFGRGKAEETGGLKGQEFINTFTFGKNKTKKRYPRL